MLQVIFHLELPASRLMAEGFQQRPWPLPAITTQVWNSCIWLLGIQSHTLASEFGGGVGAGWPPLSPHLPSTVDPPGSTHQGSWSPVLLTTIFD